MDNRLANRVALYCLERSKRDSLAHLLMFKWCMDSGLTTTEYIDKRMPQQGHYSEWYHMLNDVARGLYSMLVIWDEQHSESLDKYCEGYNTKVEVLLPFAYLEYSGRRGKVYLNKKVRR